MGDTVNPVRDIYSISRLNREVRALLEGSFPPVWIQGEISNLARPASGHVYFTLKDADSQVRCVMFRNRNQYLRFKPANGDEILARVTVSLYEGRGEFQLVVESMDPAGDGALQRAFEELKQRLAKAGLFNEDHKKALPDFPVRIGVITSPTGAAIRDILSILRRRYPLAQVIIYPVPVQGEGAAEQISRTVSIADERKECDVLILARGGGSLEDLRAFNEEILAHAIYQCRVPLVSGIGHEIDFTIADFVADRRAATPSAAAELVSPDQQQIAHTIRARQDRIMRFIKQALLLVNHKLLILEKRLPHPARQLQSVSQRLDEYSLRKFHSIQLLNERKQTQLLELTNRVNNLNPAHRLKNLSEKSVFLQQRLHQAISHSLYNAHTQVTNLAHTLDTVSPLATLARGYAIVTDMENKTVIQESGQLKAGESIITRFSKGRIKSTVDTILDDKKFSQ
ncbi:MAG: exodeoxyribonuclease VII large subunit [Gammaproteobacteria bacterium RBG_16_51_14]|nr:MAG: exodeoxyribonuclease VII large subunit [Gammaproteobacteria bacterium RBG_16_51_14]